MARAGVRLAWVTVAIAVGFADPAAAQSDCKAKQVVKDSSFTSRVCDMPDFDQRRLGWKITGVSDTRVFQLTKLLGDGGCHCVPTSLTDLLGYYAQKGVDIPPGKYPWRGRTGFNENASNAKPLEYLDLASYPTQEVKSYNYVTDVVKKLGETVEVGDGACGTGFDDVIDSYFDFAEDNDVAYAYLGFGSTDLGEKSARSMAAVMFNGGLNAVSYGKYKDYERDGSEVNVGERAGGHVIAVAGIEGSLGFPTLNYNDPNNAKSSDRLRQAQFRTKEIDLRRLKDVGVFDDDWYLRFGPDSGGEKQNLISGYMSVFPHWLIASQGNTIKWVSGFDLNRQNGATISRTGMPVPAVRTVKTDGRVIDAAPMPLTGEIAYLEEGSDVVKAVVPGSDVRRVLGPAPAGAMDIETSPTGRSIFALGKQALLAYRRDGGVSERMKLSEPAAAIAFDWTKHDPSEQRLGLVSAADRELTLLKPTNLKRARTLDLEPGLLKGSGDVTATFDPSGRLQVRVGDGSVRTRGAAALALPEGSRGLATMDTGVTLTAAGRKIFTRGGLSPFAGVAVGQARVLAVTHSGADVPERHVGELMDAEPFEPSLPQPDETTSTPTPTATPTAIPTALPTVTASPTPGATATATATAAPARANLVIASVADRQAVIRNAGNAAARPSKATLTRSGDSALVFDIPSLNAGATTTITFSCRRFESRSLTVDSANTLAESDETDNTRTFTSNCTD